MTTSSQKREATVEPTPASLKTPLVENSQVGDLIPGLRKIPRAHSENLDNIRSSLRKEIMSDLTKILAEKGNAKIDSLNYQKLNKLSEPRKH